MLSALALAFQQPDMSPDAILDDLQHRAVRFFWEQSNPANGFTKDRAPNDRTVAPSNEIASSASVGFALVAYPIGVERKWLDRGAALDRTKTTLRCLLTEWPQEHGWLFHFVDARTGKREWNCEASTIDTSICLAGILAAERYWKDPEITRLTQSFVSRIDWKWVLTDGGKKPNETRITMGWSPENGFISGRWGDTFDECKMLYIQAYGLSDIRNDGWDKLQRTPVHYQGLDLLTGGPLFMHQMSESFYDFRNQRDRLGFNYAVESRNAALGNRLYCIENPKRMKGYGPNFWGLSASDIPGGYTANGAPGWISDDGTITPTSAVAAVQFAPVESKAFAVAMRRDHPKAWGRYGFPNGYNPTQNWIGPDVLGIDLGMMLLAIENYRTGLPMKLSASHPAIKRGFQRAGFTKSAEAKPDLLQKH